MSKDSKHPIGSVTSSLHNQITVPSLDQSSILSLAKLVHLEKKNDCTLGSIVTLLAIIKATLLTPVETYCNSQTPILFSTLWSSIPYALKAGQASGLFTTPANSDASISRHTLAIL